MKPRTHTTPRNPWLARNIRSWGLRNALRHCRNIGMTLEETYEAMFGGEPRKSSH